MPQYTVQKGDTLSAIAKRFGVSVGALGYSGDPRKLGVGTVLNWGGSSPAPSGGAPAPAPSAPASPPDPLDQYLADARAQLDPGFKDVLTTTEEAGKIQSQNLLDLATRTLNREPLVRQTYANLAAELDQSKATETTQAQDIGEQNIGEAKASLASAGVENAQGSFRAPVTAQEKALQANIASIADKYNVKQETLTQQLNADVASLEDQAAQYQAQGNQAAADTLTKLAQLKADHDSQIQQLARQEFQAATQAQKEAFNEQLQMMKLDQANERLNIMEKHLAITAGNANKPTDAEVLSSAYAHWNSELSGVTGNDGYVSPTDFKKGLSAWQSQGFTTDDYLKQFYGYINPTHPQDYGLSASKYKSISTGK